MKTGYALMKTATWLPNEAKPPARRKPLNSHFFMSPLAGVFIFGAAKFIKNTSLSRRAENVTVLLFVFYFFFLISTNARTPITAAAAMIIAITAPFGMPFVSVFAVSSVVAGSVVTTAL